MSYLIAEGMTGGYGGADILHVVILMLKKAKLL